MRFRRLVLILLVIVVFTACTSSRSFAPPTQTAGPSTPTPNIGSIDIPKTDPTMMATSPAGIPATGGFDIPPEIAGHEKEWPLANHDYANTRAAVGSSINASNVSTLKFAWSSPLKGTSEWGGGTGNPVVADGVVYFQDMGANVYAVDLKTGDTL